MLRGLVIALAVVVGVIAWMATRDGDDEPASAPEAAGARIVSEEELADVAATAGHPVYWAGPVEGTELELSEEAAGGVLVRYLEEGSEAGQGRAQFLAVGSYPLADPEQALDAFARQQGAIVRRAPGAGRVVTNQAGRTNVYFTDPANQVQVEVYDPSPQRAMRLVLAGRIEPVG